MSDETKDDITAELDKLDKKDADARPEPPQNVKSSVYAITNRGPARRVIYDGLHVKAPNPAASGMRQIIIDPGQTVEARLADALVQMLSDRADEPLRFVLASKVKKDAASKFAPL